MSLSSGSCWDILELKSTTDKKLIKRAYHKLLRQYKPDEYPTEFKILYQAYQDALEWKEEEYYAWKDTDDDFNHEEEYEHKIDEDVDIKQEELRENLYNDYWQRWAIFEEKVDELTYNNNYPELFNQLEKWSFLEELDITSDLDFFKEASRYLFLATNTFDEKYEKTLLNAEVIQYFDKIFLWKKQWQEFDQESTVFEYLDVKNDIILFLEKEEKKKNYASLRERIAVFGIDLIIPVILAFLEKVETFSEVIMVVAIYYMAIQTIFFWFLGLKSMGQFVMKQEVLEGLEQENPTLTARGLRLVFTYISMGSVLMFVASPIENQIAFIPIALNAVFWFSNKRLIQDYTATRIYSFR